MRFRRRRRISPDRLVLILRYCRPWREVWAPTAWWREPGEWEGDAGEPSEAEPMWKRHTRALALADERDAAALRRARPWTDEIRDPALRHFAEAYTDALAARSVPLAP